MGQQSGFSPLPRVSPAPSPHPHPCWSRGGQDLCRVLSHSSAFTTSKKSSRILGARTNTESQIQRGLTSLQLSRCSNHVCKGRPLLFHGSVCNTWAGRAVLPLPGDLTELSFRGQVVRFSGFRSPLPLYLRNSYHLYNFTLGY